MYNKKLAVAIKTNGKILREFANSSNTKDTVYIPFGSEYSVLLKNLNTVRVLTNVYIDGTNATPGGLVLNAGQEIDLERWIKNGNLSTGNRFKFIERTGAVENHRGIKLEDGLIKVEYQFEKVYTPSWPVVSSGHWEWKPDYWRHDYYGSPWYRGMTDTIGSSDNSFGSTVGMRGSSLGGVTSNAIRSKGVVGSTVSMNSVNTSSVTPDSAEYSSLQGDESRAFYNDAGITVPGSKSNQQFQTAAWFATETEQNVIILKLLGETPDNKPIRKAVTVKAKTKCTTCGTMNKAHAHFCHKCGTSLKIFA
jgi:hypothetical protein